MRKWYLPLTVLGLGGLGVLFATEKGREALSRAVDFLDEFPARYSDWSAQTEIEIANIQSAIDKIAHSLGALQPAR
jgi:hypothetical protein